MNATRDDIANVIVRLTGAFGPPFGLTAKDTGAVVDAWHSALYDCQAHDVLRAAADLIRERPAGSKWPAPADIRKRVLAFEGARNAAKRSQETEGDAPFCLGCRTRDLISTPKRFYPLHKDGCRVVHEIDRERQKLLVAEGAEIWRDGKEQKRRSTPELLAEHQQRELVTT